jgi:hypothetical protein
MSRIAYVRKPLQFNPPPVSDRIDLSYTNGGVTDNVSGTRIVCDGETVTIVAGKSKTLTRRQAHTMFYAFMILTGWDEEEKRTI